MILPSTKTELELVKKGIIPIGVDEVGRGPLAGPVVAAAAWVDPKFFKKDFDLKKFIRDSKTLSEKKRNEIFLFLEEEKGFEVAIGEVSPKTIDRINILNASLLAMRLAIENLNNKLSKNFPLSQRGSKGVLDKEKLLILVDGNKIIPGVVHQQKAFIKGDRDIFSIAVASIYAKVYRDNIMIEYHQKFPQYGFDCHKGYGTKKHMEALQEVGVCEIHRQSFGPVREVVDN